MVPSTGIEPVYCVYGIYSTHPKIFLSREGVYPSLAGNRLQPHHGIIHRKDRPYETKLGECKASHGLMITKLFNF